MGSLIFDFSEYSVQRKSVTLPDIEHMIYYIINSILCLVMCLESGGDADVNSAVARLRKAVDGVRGMRRS